MASTKPVPVLNGPIGAGKTTTVFIKAIRTAAKQMRSTRDGKIKFKLCVVRDTYRQLWKTTLPSWWKRVPRAVGEFTGAENAPATHRVDFQLADGSVVEFQADFVAIGENAVEDVLRGYEPTAFYLNEADLLAKEVFTFARGRAGRYPDMSEGGPSWYGIFMDCNAPELTAWMYTDIFRNTPEFVDLFRQPSGLSPDAENLINLPPGYYDAQVGGQPDWYLKRMIMNVPGYSRAGKPIYSEFNFDLHVSRRPLEPIPGLALTIGLDAGMSPAAVIGQRLPDGRRHILDELVSEQGTGAMRFGDMLAKLLHDRYRFIRNVRAFADPSAAYGNDKKAGEKSWIEIVAAKAGIRIEPAPTNRILPRIEAVRRPLCSLIEGKPAVLYDQRCAVLIEGFNSGYRFRKLQGSEERYTDQPEKNEYSHVHDANQYLHSADGEDLEIRERKTAHEGQLRAWAAAAQHDWDPLAAR
jgi:hypothetical protein